MPTLKELAASTGYSPATISRILTGDPDLAVSDETRRRGAGGRRAGPTTPPPRAAGAVRPRA